MAAVRFPKTEVVITQLWIEIPFRDRDLLSTTALSNWNWKLTRDVSSRHLENLNDVITTRPMARFTKISKPEVVFQNDFHLFLQNRK